MKQRTWPDRSERSRFTALPLTKSNGDNRRREFYSSSCTHKSKIKRHSHHFYSRSSQSTDGHDFATLPFDILTKIAASFTHPQLRAASLVCKSWSDALRPLREAMVLLMWGKRFKHGRGGVRKNLDKALDSFLKGAERGSTLAMVDAGLIYWELGKKETAIGFYKKAAELGDPAGQCNLAISYLQAQPPKPEEAEKWLYQAALAGHARAQYQLALCLHKGCGLQQAARWYLKAAEGGYLRAMYNTSLCYSAGKGLPLSHRQARKWMKRAADRGHRKAQFEHGLALFSEGEMMKAVVYLELATRAGEMAAAHIKNVILEQLSVTSRNHVMLLADNWRALPSSC
ncbi:F-box protein At1g70590-like [Pistacia vera]|uniref:F-box protein At1g70590-like n=1 Tax=Pistacia vera TaxID=55513 RepID=UPI0012637BE2|nr:F-box protein At1g70590-like [Pistacia vera]